MIRLRFHGCFSKAWKLVIKELHCQFQRVISEFAMMEINKCEQMVKIYLVSRHLQGYPQRRLYKINTVCFFIFVSFFV